MRMEGKWDVLPKIRGNGKRQEPDVTVVSLSIPRGGLFRIADVLVLTILAGHRDWLMRC